MGLVFVSPVEWQASCCDPRPIAFRRKAGVPLRNVLLGVDHPVLPWHLSEDRAMRCLNRSASEGWMNEGADPEFS